MISKTALFLAGVCVGAALAAIAKAARPLGAYALSGGMLAYESACDAIEASEDFLRASVEEARKTMKARKARDVGRT